MRKFLCNVSGLGLGGANCCSYCRWKYYFVFLAFAFAYGIVAFLFYPETQNLTLEEAGELMDQPTKSRMNRKKKQVC